MKWVLRLKDYEENDKYIFFEYLEEIPLGGYYMSPGKLKNAEKFDSESDAISFLKSFDDCGAYEAVTLESCG